MAFPAAPAEAEPSLGAHAGGRLAACNPSLTRARVVELPADCAYDQHSTRSSANKFKFTAASKA
jgi:hypothetical protein